MSTFKRSKLLMQEDLEKRARKRNLKDEKDRSIGELGHGVKNRNRRRLYKKKGGHVKSRGKAVRGGGAEIK